MMLNFMGFHIPQDGYGYGTLQIATELRRIDSGVKITDMATHGEWGQPDERVWALPGAAVALCLPDWYPDIVCERLIGYTMFEASQIPRGWAKIINHFCERLLVPCEWNREVFTANGVDVPIELAPWGINPDDYWYIDRYLTPDLTPDPSPKRRGESRP